MKESEISNNTNNIKSSERIEKEEEEEINIQPEIKKENNRPIINILETKEKKEENKINELNNEIKEVYLEKSQIAKKLLERFYHSFYGRDNEVYEKPKEENYIKILV